MYKYRDQLDTGIKLEVGKMYCTGDGECVTIVAKSEPCRDGAVTETWEGDDGSWWHTNGTLGMFEGEEDFCADFHIVCENDDPEYQ